jgi:bifunctional DNase/RNase
MIEFELSRIVINETIAEQLIVLKEKTGSRMLPIVIGILEARAIQMYVDEQVLPRPLTHDLLAGVIQTLGARLRRMEIVNLDKGTFFGRLILSIGGRRVECDCRPSDGIALATLIKAPIFIAERVFEKLAEQGDEA